MDQVVAHLNVDGAVLLLLNPRTQQLELRMDRGFINQEKLHNLKLRLGESYAGKAALERRIIRRNDLPGDVGRPEFSSYLVSEGFITFFGVPLISKGEVKGVLEVLHRTSFVPDDEWLDFLDAFAGQAAIAIDNALLFTDTQKANNELIRAYDATIEGWAKALEMRDGGTEGHSQRVTKMTVDLAQMMNIRAPEIIHIQRGALLHDIGKMGVPDSILLKTGQLNDREWEIMRNHSEYAYRMLSPIEFLRPAINIPYCHHEQWDGSGYPRGLREEQIPMEARIFAVIDVWDALTHDRPYRKSWEHQDAINYIHDQSGKRFDPVVVSFFDRQLPIWERDFSLSDKNGFSNSETVKNPPDRFD
jgi:HD-GYP domain-containing protein (c-di-GMP phosphodiesterase class II)